MRFQVPQFIGVEDKILGPLTIKQGLYLAGGGGLCFIIIRFLPLFLAIILCAPVIVLSLALAFYKINNKPFIFTLEGALKYFWNEKLYIWKRDDKKIIAREKQTENTLLYVPKLSDSKLKDLIWSLDVTDTLNPVTKNSKTIDRED